MATLTGIREGLAVNLQTLQGCNVYAYVMGSPVLPTIEIFPDAVSGTEYHQAMQNGLHRWHLGVRGMVAVNDGIAAQKLLDAWLADTGSDSVFAAINSDPTLGGTAGGLIVRGHSGYQEYVRDGLSGSVLAVVWAVEVLAAGT